VKDIPADAVNATLETSHAQVIRTLTHALAQHGVPPSTPPVPAAPQSAPATAVSWAGWPVVQRRIRLLHSDADKIIVHSEAIVQNVSAN
jgi:hypothetical protein